MAVVAATELELELGFAVVAAAELELALELALELGLAVVAATELELEELEVTARAAWKRSALTRRYCQDANRKSTFLRAAAARRGRGRRGGLGRAGRSSDGGAAGSCAGRQGSSHADEEKSEPLHIERR